MSVNGWKRRLAKRGLQLDLRRVSGGMYCAWVTAPLAPVDQRFSPLVGLGWAGSYSDAIPAALSDFQARWEDRQREQTVLALADPSARVNTGSVAAVGPTR